MFSSVLSCLVFGLPRANSGWYLQAARRWSHQPGLAESAAGVIHWTNRTKLHVDGAEWYATPNPMELDVKNALVRIGDTEAHSLFAFVSPFADGSTVFRSAVSKYSLARKRPSEPEDIVVDFAVNLQDLTMDLRQAEAPELRAVRGVDDEGRRVALSRDRLLVRVKEGKLGGINQIKAVSLEVANRRVEINDGCGMALDDVSLQVGEVADCLSKVFDRIREHVFVRKTETSLSAPAA